MKFSLGEPINSSVKEVINSLFREVEIFGSCNSAITMLTRVRLPTLSYAFDLTVLNRVIKIDQFNT